MKKYISTLFFGLLALPLLANPTFLLDSTTFSKVNFNPFKFVQQPVQLKTVNSSTTINYCIPAEITDVEAITSVAFKTSKKVIFENNSAVTSTVGYEDFASLTPADLRKTSNYKIELKGSTNGAYYSSFVVMIDFNNDGIFGSTGAGDNTNFLEVIRVGELLYNSTGTDGKSVTALIEIPQNAVVGKTRMRILKRQTDLKSMNYAMNPCDLESTYGQIEDYTLNILEPKVCENAPAGDNLGEVYVPFINQQKVMVKDAAVGSYTDVLVYSGNRYDFKTTNESVYISLVDKNTKLPLSGGEGGITWVSDRTGVVRVYLSGDENCSLPAIKTDITLLSTNKISNPINEPCNVGIQTVGFLLSAPFKTANNQEIAIDLSAYAGRATTVSGIKINLLGDATTVDFDVLADLAGTPGDVIDKIKGTIVEKKLLGTFNGQKGYTYDITFDKAVEINALDVEHDVFKWLNVKTDAQAIELNSNYSVGYKVAIKNTTTTQGKWKVDDTKEAVYQLKAECTVNMCKQVVPYNADLPENAFPNLTLNAITPVYIDILVDQGKTLELNGIEVDGWYTLLIMKGDVPADVIPQIELSIVDNDPAKDEPIKATVTPIKTTLESENKQFILIKDVALDIALIQKRVTINFEKPLKLDGTKSQKYWLKLKATDLASYDINQNGNTRIGSLPIKVKTEFPEKEIPDILSIFPYELVYRLKTTCTNLGTDDQIKVTDLKVYPNPFTNQVTVESLVKIKQIEIFNMAGLKVNSTTTNDKKVNVNLGNLPAGVYLLRSLDENGKTNVQKLIKK